MSGNAGKLLWLARGLPLTVALAWATPSSAQMGGGMGPGMGGMGHPGGAGAQPEKEEGPAEVAPDAEEKSPPANETDVNYQTLSHRRTKIIEFDGYYRVRTDYFYDLNMGQGYQTSGGTGPAAQPPFPIPTDCFPKNSLGGALQGPSSCSDKSLSDTNMRLRIEPTLNISDQVRIRTMFDIFDNLVLGTTPNSLISPSEYSANQPQSPTPLGQTTTAAPTDILSTTQNSYASSVLAKWVWAEIDSELGSLRFGRMPWHFGRGMYFNDGECADCDSADGTTVDRFMALTTIYGHQLALAWDIAAEGYDIGYTNLGQNDMGEFPLDLSQKNDVTQLMASLTKVDDDKTWREHINAGEVRVNYGAQLVYRSQDYATFNITPATDSTFANTGNPTTLSANDLGSSLQTNVNALLFITSLWFKLGWKALTLEAEGTLLAGKMGNAGPLRYDAPATDPGAHILQAGWVLASQLKLYGDSLFIGFENGGATGENAETAYTAQGQGYVPYLNYNWQFVPLPKGEKTLSAFHFSPDYHVDEILFRRIMGTVSNAIYFKPSIAYWLDLDSSKVREIGISGSAIYSLAPVPTATPGHSINYGIEMDLGLQYRNRRDNFYAGFTWGVFWPMGALSRNYETDGNANNVLWASPEGANAAQVVRTFLGIKF